MTAPDQRFERPISEGEPTPKIVVTGIGFEHRPYNLQGIATVFQQLTEGLEAKNGGRRIVYLENPGKTARDVERIKADVDTYGGLTGYLVKEGLIGSFGIAPTPDRVKATINVIALAVKNGNYDSLPNDAQAYLLYRGLDEIRQETDFEVDFEAQTPGIIKNDESTYARYQRLSLETQRYWSAGQFAQFLERYKRAKSTIHASGAMRNPGIAEQIRRRIKELQQDPEGGSIVLLLGESHLPVIDMLQRQIGRTAPVIFEKRGGRVFRTSTEGILDKALSSKQQASDLVYAQSAIVAFAIGELAPSLKASGYYDYFMNNYEDIYEACSEIAKGLTLDQMRQLCEARSSLATFFWERMRPLIQEG